MASERDAVGTETNAYGVKLPGPIYATDASNNIIGLVRADGNRVPIPITLFSLPITGTPTVSGVGELIFAQYLIPAGTLANNGDKLRMTLTATKSGGTGETFTGRIRVGTAGTIADALVTAGNLIVTTQTASGFLMDIRRNSATTLQHMGPGNTSLGSYPGGSTSSIQAEATVPNLDTTDVYISVSALSNAATEVATLVEWEIELRPKA